MKTGCFWSFSFVLLACLLIGGLFARMPADAAFFKKQFRVCKDQGNDILCDPYVVQKDDFVIKLLKQRGEIAHEDFPRFLEIFSRINPEISDIDRIYPGRRILIPLKILPSGTLAGQSTGKVTLPIIMVSDLPELMLKNSSVYEVRAGDTVWDLVVERFGGLGRKEYLKLKELVKYMNPELRDLNFIDIGDRIRLPESSVRNTLWYDALFDQFGDVAAQQPFAEAAANRDGPPGGAAGQSEGPAENPEDGSRAEKPHPLYRKAARILRADLMDQGDFFFPRQGRSDYRLALDQTPIMELPGGLRLVFDSKGRVAAGAASIIKQHWRNSAVIRMEPDFSLRDIFHRICPVLGASGCAHKLTIEDQGLSVTVRGEFIFDRPGGDGKFCLNFLEQEEAQTPIAIRRYLGHHWVAVEDWVLRSGVLAPAEPPGIDSLVVENVSTLHAGSRAGFARQLLSLLGCDFQGNVQVVFPYAGFQVRATTNKVSVNSGDSGNSFFVDFGDLQGDAIHSIEAETGLPVVQIREARDYYAIARKLLSALPFEQEKPPLFWAADRPRIHNTSIRVPGTLVSASSKSGAAKEILITDGELPPEIQYFLSGKGLTLIQVPRQ